MYAYVGSDCESASSQVQAGKVPASAQPGSPLSRNRRATSFHRGMLVISEFSRLAGENAVNPGTSALKPSSLNHCNFKQCKPLVVRLAEPPG